MVFRNFDEPHVQLAPSVTEGKLMDELLFIWSRRDEEWIFQWEQAIQSTNNIHKLLDIMWVKMVIGVVNHPS